MDAMDEFLLSYINVQLEQMQTIMNSLDDVLPDKGDIVDSMTDLDFQLHNTKSVVERVLREGDKHGNA